MAKKEKVAEQKGFDGFEKVGGFEADFFSFKSKGDIFEGIYEKTETVDKKSKFSKNPVETKRFFFNDYNGKKWQIDNMGNLGYLIEQADLQPEQEVKIVYNGKKKGTNSKKEYHNFDLFVKK